MERITWQGTSILQRDPNQKEAVYAIDNGPCWYGTTWVGTFVVSCHDGGTPVGRLRSGSTYAAILHARDGRVRVLGDRVAAHKAVALCRAENKHLQSLEL